MGGGYSSVAEHLLSMHKVPGSIPSASTKKISKSVSKPNYLPTLKNK